jgi:xyloglucan-specific endo-beta-1,4-glucanase
MMKRISQNDGFIVQGKYYIYNNLWGAETGSGSQCVWGSSINGSRISWGTSWKWTGNSETIKSYAAVVFGWHWGWKVANTDLPAQLSSIRRVLTSWNFSLKQKIIGGTNISYDIWLSDNHRQDTENPTGEIMIWLYNTGNICPIGSKQINTIVDGAGWDLWVGPHPVSGWPVYSFVRTDNTNTASLDLLDFFRYLFTTGLSSSSYLLSVEAGAEVFVGEGSLETTLYSIEVELK